MFPPIIKSNVYYLLIIAAAIILSTPAYSFEIPFAFTKDSAGLENLTPDQLVDLYNNTLKHNGIPLLTENKTVKYAYAFVFADKIAKNSSNVRLIADEIIKGHSGELTLDQIFTIYDYLRYGRGEIGGWYYVSDPLINANISEEFRSASETLELGESMNHTGAGDCDDFAIVMASLVNNIGGTVRIVLVKNNGTPVHAYSEVYLGCLNDTDNEIYYLTQLLMLKYRVDKIYAHIDPLTKDVWLNLDTPLNLGEKSYPGIPYLPGSAHDLIIILPPDHMRKINPPEYRLMLNIINESMNSPEALSNLSKVDENVLLFQLLAERNGLNSSEVPSTDQLVLAAYNMLGSYGLFDLDMAKLAYANTSVIANSSTNSTYLVFDLQQMLSNPDVMQVDNTSASANNSALMLSEIANNSAIMQDGKSIPLSTFFKSLGLAIR